MFIFICKLLFFYCHILPKKNIYVPHIAIITLEIYIYFDSNGTNSSNFHPYEVKSCGK